MEEFRHNPLRQGIRNADDANVVLRYFFWVICVVPIVESILWFFTIFAAQQIIVRPTSAVAVATLVAYMLFKQKKTKFSIYLCIYLSLFYWLGRCAEDLFVGKRFAVAFANLIPIVGAPLFFLAARRVREAIEFLNKGNSDF